MIDKYKNKIRIIEDFPVEGVKFRDICPVIEDYKLFNNVVIQLSELFKDEKIDKVAGIESRGFVFSAPLAFIFKVGHIMLRKKDKLPYDKYIEKHSLEYGRGSLEMHMDSVKYGDRVLIIDDVLSTGGTAMAGVKLIERAKGVVVGLGFFHEIDMGGRKLLKKYNIKVVTK